MADVHAGRIPACITPPPLPDPPILDLRPRLSWQKRLPARLGTAGLWLGSCWLLGPAKQIGRAHV